MAIYAVFLLAVCFSATSAAHKPCGLGQCQFVPVGQNPAVKFQQLASEEGVRLVFFNLEIGNNSVHPLESNERLLAKRWIWAKTIQEPMLRMRDTEYDIYSLGLLTRQKRYMSVQLEEKPPTCLSQLNTSCQDNVVAEALLGKITNLSPGNRFPQTGSVCTYHKSNSSSQEGWKFLCCSAQNNAERNHTIIRCGLALGNVWFTKPFTAVYILLAFILCWYSPAIPLLIPDWLFNVQHERDKEIKKERQDRHNQASLNEQCIEPTEIDRQPLTQSEVYMDDEASNSSAETDSEYEEISPPYHEKEDQELSKFEIPVDDNSPITVSALLGDYIKELPQIQISFNLKLFFFIFVVFPIFLHLKLAVVYFYNLEYYQESSRKRQQPCTQDGHFFTVCLSLLFDFRSQWKPTLVTTTAFISSILLFVVIPFIKPKDLLKPPFGQLIAEVLERQSQYVFNFTHFMMEKYMSKLIKLSLSGRTGKSRRRRAYRFMRNFLLIFPVFLFGATLSIVFILIFLIGLLGIFVLFSPIVQLIFFVSSKTNEINILKSTVKAGGYSFILQRTIVLALSLLMYVSLIVAVLVPSVLFITNIFFLTIVGLVLNYEFVTPYVVFISVVAANIYLCYSNLQSRYREVKGMILNHWEEETKDLSWIKCRNKGTIPKELFWSVCGNEEDNEESDSKMQILPLRTEIFFMLRNVALIVSFLCLFFLAILFFETVEEISALVSTFFVFISGVIPKLIFKRFTKKKKFSGRDKIKIDNKIKKAVREYVLLRVEEIPHPY